MSEKINIQELTDLLANRHGLHKNEADVFVKEFFQLIKESLEKDKYVKIKGLGTFKLIDVESRESVNVNTGERIEIQGHTKVSFTPDNGLKEIINRPFAHFETVLLQNEALLATTPLEGEGEEELPLQEMQTEKEPVLEKPMKETVATEAVTAIAPDGRSEKVVASEEVVSTAIPYEKLETVSVAEDAVSAAVPDEKPEKAVATKTLPESIPDEPTERNVSEENPVKDHTMHYFIGIVAFIVLLCAVAVVFLYCPTLSDRLWKRIQPVSQEQEETTKDMDSEKVPSDTISVDSVFHSASLPDTVTEPPVPVIEKQVDTPPSSDTTGAVLFQAEAGEYDIVGTAQNYTLHEGETLVRVSLRLWGTKALWPYIVKHNPDVITNPDHVPVGTVLKIPKLKKK